MSFLKTTRYESGTGLELVEERMGAASLWMLSTKTGEAEANSGTNEAAIRPFIMGKDG